MTTAGAKNSARALMIRTIGLAAALAAAAALASLIFWGKRQCISVAAGACIAMASFSVLAAVIARSISGGGRSIMPVAFLGIAKLVAIGALLWWLITRGHAEPVSFLAGFTTMVAALVIQGASARRRESAKADRKQGPGHGKRF